MAIPKVTKHAVIIFFLWAFAPIAWFMLWRDKKYHSWFPKLLWVNAIIFSVIFITQSFVFIPKLEQIYHALKIEVPSSTTPFAALIVLAFVLLQIPAGVHLQRKIEKHKKLADKYVIPILFIFLVDGIIAFSTGFVAAIQSPAAFVDRYIQTTVIKKPEISNISAVPSPTIVPTVTPSPTPRPLSFSEMNTQFGPCVILPTLMYHHVEDQNIAVKNKRTGLNVEPAMFATQMDYLSQKGYKTVTMQDLINFFESGTPISKNSLLITFDDGYEDFYFNVYPILKRLNLRVTVFLPTGLISNAGYLNWGQISEMQASGVVTFGNHTWSHKQINAGDSHVIDQEIKTADSQLTEHGLNVPKTFAYPYGPTGKNAQESLTKNGYKVAFTTASGRTLCKKQSLTLPRVRIGNKPLANFGF